MTRNLKALGLALIAVFAMSAMAATAASAQEGELTTNGGVTATGTQSGTHKFVANGNEVTCATTKFHASIANGDKTATVTPTYENCHIIFLFTFNATVTTTGCDYHLSDLTTGGPEYTAKVGIQCEAGKSIKVDVPVAGCHLTIGSHTPSTPTVDVTNMAGSPDDVTINATVGGISFTSSGGPCGPSGAGATYTGNTTVTAEDGEGNPKNLTVSHP